MNLPHAHKIIAPQRPETLVSRQRLIAPLQQITKLRLILLTAPAGYGKTSLLLDFVYSGVTLPICWFTLDRHDADPWVFVTYLAGTVASQFPDKLVQTNHALATEITSSPTSFATITNQIAREIDALGKEFVLVLDDWHFVDDVPVIKSLISELITRCPNLHIILASRVHPSLPDMLLLTARRQVSGLDEDTLRFTPEEVMNILATDYQVPISLDTVTELTERVHGWIAGILLSVQVGGASTAFAPSLNTERQIYAFLHEQVLDRQPPQVQRFLLDAAVLDELSADQCDRVFGQHNSGSILHELQRQHVFISEVGPGLFRFHTLFREFLVDHYRRTDRDHYRNMAHRVASVYREQQQWSLAFEAYIAADDLLEAQQVVAVIGDHLRTSGRIETLERWFAALPLEELSASLLALKARVLLQRGHHHEVEVLISLAQTRMQPEEAPLVLLVQSQMARVLGRYEEARNLGLQALSASRDDGQRAAALRMLASSLQLLGDTTGSIEALQQALTIERQRGNIYMLALINHDLGLCHEKAGLLREAEQYYTQADACWATLGHRGARAHTLNSKGVVQHLTGRYQIAYATFLAAREDANAANVPDYEATIEASLADLYSDLKLFAQAGAAYARARTLGGSAYLISYIDIAEIHLSIRQHRFEAAEDALNRLPESTHKRQAHQITVLQAMIACGRIKNDEARNLINHAISAFAKAGDLMSCAQAHLIRAHIYARSLPLNRGAFLDDLRKATEIAGQLGHDAFLITGTFHLPGVIRHAHEAGWPTAEIWSRRHQELRRLATVLDTIDHRPLLTVRAFGADHIMINNDAIDLTYSNAREVLYLLLTHPDGVSIERLSENIWPDGDHSSNVPRNAIYRLRNALPEGVIISPRKQLYVLNRQALQIDYDVERFTAILDGHNQDVDALFEAIDLYTGPYLDWSDKLWCSGLRAALEQRYLQTLHHTAVICEKTQMLIDALMLYRRISILDELNESAHAGIMRCQLGLGNRAAAIEQFHTVRGLLREQLGIEPGPDTEVGLIYRAILKAS